MTEDDFQVDRMDNVTLFVPDRYEAAQWLEEVLGLEIRPEYEEWAADEEGPLMISPGSGKTMLAVCKEQPEQSNEVDIHQHIAFRVDGDKFLQFLDGIEELSLTDADGEPVTKDDIIDFDLSFAIHFHDPYGNQFELTTYDYQSVETALN